MLQTPPGINQAAAAGQHPQGDAGNVVQNASIEVPLAMLEHPASATIEAGQSEAERSGGNDFGTPGSSLPASSGSASSGRGPSMHNGAPSDARDALPIVDSSFGKGGDLDCLSGRVAGELGKAPQQKKVVFIDGYPIAQTVKQKEERKARPETFAEVV